VPDGGARREKRCYTVLGGIVWIKTVEFEYLSNKFEFGGTRVKDGRRRISIESYERMQGKVRTKRLRHHT
jgi:hypothetical protein